MEPLAMAHRGFTLQAPENTLPAFQAAIDAGADGIETDVQMTRDGDLVIHHDATIDATSDGTGTIAQMSLEQLRTYDFGAYRGAQWTGTRIPTLDECLDTVHAMKLVNIELKAQASNELPYVEPVVAAIRAHGMAAHVVISSFDHDLIRQVKEIAPDIETGALTVSTPFAGSKDDCVAPVMGADRDLAAYLQRLDFPVDYLHPHFSSVLEDPTLAARLAAAGIGCNVWTVDDAAHVRQMADAGCSAIIGNRVDIVLRTLGR
jgi:glycerophosphoryl diester phosphodiesterase